jgi:anti-sigma regulatory factor (Ser/Thr protein kinase)
MVVARGVPDSEAVLVPHASTGVGAARHRLIADLTDRGVDAELVDDAALVLSELLSNALKHAHALPSGSVRAAWGLRDDKNLLAIEVTDGGGPTRPRRSSPSLTARGGRGLSIIDALAAEWGVRGAGDEVTVWAHLAVAARAPERAEETWDFDFDAVEPLEG